MLRLTKTLLSDKFTPAASGCYLAPLEPHWNKGLSKPSPCQGHHGHPSQQVPAALAPGSSSSSLSLAVLALPCSPEQAGAARRLSGRLITQGSLILNDPDLQCWAPEDSKGREAGITSSACTHVPRSHQEALAFPPRNFIHLLKG